MGVDRGPLVTVLGDLEHPVPQCRPTAVATRVPWVGEAERGEGGRGVEGRGGGGEKRGDTKERRGSDYTMYTCSKGTCTSIHIHVHVQMYMYRYVYM